MDPKVKILQLLIQYNFYKSSLIQRITTLITSPMKELSLDMSKNCVLRWLLLMIIPLIKGKSSTSTHMQDHDKRSAIGLKLNMHCY